MKTVFLSLCALALFSGAALAQIGAGSDSFAGATLVPATGGRVLNVVDLSTYTQQNGEPLANEFMAPHTAWWRYVSAEGGFCVVDTLARGGSLSNATTNNSLVAIYTGSSINNLTRVAVSRQYVSYAEGGSEGAAVRFYAEKGSTYYIQLSSTWVTANLRNVLMWVRPLPTKPLRKSASWSFINAEGATDFAGVSVLVNPSGAVTGKLQLSSGVLPFAGILDGAGYLRVSVLPKPKKGAPPPLPITLSFSGGYGGTIYMQQEGDVIRDGTFYDVMPTADVPVGNWSGNFNYMSPSIHGPALMKVKPNKTVSIAARGRDGAAFTVNAPISRYFDRDLGGVTFLKFTNGGKAGYMASLQFSELGGWNLGGMGLYKRAPNPKAALYPDGFVSHLNSNLYPYTKPMTGQRAAGLLNESAGVGKLSIVDPHGEFGGNLDLPLTFDTNNKFVFVNDPVRKPVLKLNTTTGQVTGSIILGGKKRSIFGSVYKNSFGGNASGYISGTTRNVLFWVLP